MLTSPPLPSDPQQLGTMFLLNKDHENIVALHTP